MEIQLFILWESLSSCLKFNLNSKFHGEDHDGGSQIGLACISIQSLGRSKEDSWLEFQQTTSIAFCLVAESCLTLCNPMDYRMPDCPSLSPRVCSHSCPLSWWCHLAIFFSVTLSPFAFIPGYLHISKTPVCFPKVMKCEHLLPGDLCGPLEGVFLKPSPSWVRLGL